MTKKPITRREMLAYANFVAPAFGREAPDVPKARAKSRDLEHKEQVAVIQWWHLAHKAYGLPEFALFAIPNGGARHMLTAVRLKEEGVRPGIPDLFLACSPGEHSRLVGIEYQGMFIEMKVGRNKPTENQWNEIPFMVLSRNTKNKKISPWIWITSYFQGFVRGG